MVEFAQKWSLPYNDIWVFRSRSSAKSLFQFYDNIRESGLVMDVVDKLDDITLEGENIGTSFNIKSMYPHFDFQGEILEGIVVRLVKQSSTMKELQRLSNESKQILELISPEIPSLPFIFNEDGMNNKSLEALQIDLRDLFRRSNGKNDNTSNELRRKLKNSRKSIQQHEFNLIQQINE